MDPVTIAAVAAAGAAGLNFLGQKKANKANIASAREQMAFQERMSSTAHQRELNDMRLAGLNPALASKYGGASTPGGASSNSQSETSGSVSSAVEARRMFSEIVNMDIQNLRTIAEIDLIKAQTRSTTATSAHVESKAGKDNLYNKAYSDASKAYDDLTKLSERMRDGIFGAASSAGKVFKKSMHHLGSIFSKSGGYTPPRDR